MPTIMHLRSYYGGKCVTFLPERQNSLSSIFPLLILKSVNGLIRKWICDQHFFSMFLSWFFHRLHSGNLCLNCTFTFSLIIIGIYYGRLDSSYTAVLTIIANILWICIIERLTGNKLVAYILEKNDTHLQKFRICMWK